MDIEGKTIWQHAAGDRRRNYVDICLRWNVILMGPSWSGRWLSCNDKLGVKEKKVAMMERFGVSKHKVAMMERFCDKMMAGDIVVLNLGLDSVYAVGQIVGDYEWCEEFNDIDGWNIGHVRRVNWLWESKQSPKIFPKRTLKRGTTQQLGSIDVINWLKSLEISNGQWTCELPELPKSVDLKLNFEQVSEYLFDKGVARDSISSLVAQIDEFIGIANWYGRSEEKISEQETVCYLVVPLLRALGWTPQRMAIEWNNIDVALFSKLPRDKESVSIVVEAKKMGAASLSAFPQAKSYTKNYPNCKRIVVTDGLRYGVNVRKLGEEFGEKPYAYMNLTRLRDGYPAYECKGVRDAILTMVPEWSE